MRWYGEVFSASAARKVCVFRVITKRSTSSARANAFIRSASTIIMARSMLNPSSVTSQPRDAQSRAYDLVVIGGSAGGIEVLTVLLGALPARFAPAVMIVTHLPPDSPSYLVPAFAHRCALPVLEPDARE